MTASNLLVTLYPQNSKFNSCKNFCVEIHCAIVKFMFSKKATKIDETLLNVKSTVKILSIFVAFLENMNFTIASNLF